MAKRRLKRIELHTTQELDDAIGRAVMHCKTAGVDFFTVLHGIDAYMQRRKNRDKERDQRAIELSSEGLCDPWGNS